MLTLPWALLAPPAAHWAFSYHTKLQQGGFNCVAARASSAYDYFLGEGSMLAIKSYYGSSTDSKYGWDLESCALGGLPWPCHAMQAPLSAGARHAAAPSAAT